MLQKVLCISTVSFTIFSYFIHLPSLFSFTVVFAISVGSDNGLQRQQKKIKKNYKLLNQIKKK